MEFFSNWIAVIDTVLCLEVNLLALWYWWQFLHSASLHSTQTNNAGSDFSLFVRTVLLLTFLLVSKKEMKLVLTVRYVEHRFPYLMLMTSINLSGYICINVKVKCNMVFSLTLLTPIRIFLFWRKKIKMILNIFRVDSKNNEIDSYYCWMWR
jgi:hypothetical protein